MFKQGQNRVFTESRTLVIARFYLCAIHYLGPGKDREAFSVHISLALDSADVITQKVR
jgi:hypothetical protein